MNIYEKLSAIQNELKVPKGQKNEFGGYKFRSCEDILEAVKPLCKKYKVVLILDDTLENIGDRYYIKAIAKLIDIEQPYEEWGDSLKSVNCICNSAYAREGLMKKGMDESQLTGTSSSYARKYALNGLFNIDDTKDADTNEFTRITKEDTPKTKIKTIDATMEVSLREAITNKGKSTDEVLEVLKKLNCEKLSELTYENVHEFKKQLEL